MQLHFHITKALIETMPEEDYEAIEMAQDGQIRLYKLRPLVARFMADENNQPLPLEAAKRQLGKIPVGEWGNVIKSFIGALGEAAVPNMSGDSLKPLSEAEQPLESPTGSEH